MNKENRQKMKMWSPEEEVKFIDVWRDHIKELRTARRNSHIYEGMSTELFTIGVQATAKEIQRKVNNLTQRYRKEKNAMGISGGSPSNWKLYKLVHGIIGGFATYDLSKAHESIAEIPIDDDTMFLQDSCLAEFRDIASEGEAENVFIDMPSSVTPSTSRCPSAITATCEIPPRASSSASTSQEPPAKRKRNNTIQEKFLQEIKKTNNILQKEADETKELFKQSLEIDKEMVSLMRCYVLNNSNNNNNGNK